MNFAEPQALIWLWLLIPLVLLLIFGYRRRLRRMARIMSRSLFERAQGRILTERIWFKASLLTAAMAALLFSLAQPRWGFEWQEVRANGVDIMIALDLSNSMLAEDVKPNRVERAKRELIDLLQRLRGDRIGIVAFSGIAFVQCPLTADYRAAQMFIELLDTDLIPVPGTAIGDALRTATESLVKYSDAGSEGKAIILITDGEDQGTEPRQAAQSAQEAGIRIYTIGIGQPDGAPIPETGGGFKKDRQGNLVISKLDEELLQEIALTTEGGYVRSVTGDLDLERIYEQGIRSSLQGQEREAVRMRHWYERYQWFLAIAALLLIAEFLIVDVRRRASKAAIMLLTAAGLGSFAEVRAGPVDEAYKAYGQGNYQQAEQRFLEAEIEEPDDFEHAYNRGVAAYKNGDFSAAREAFAKAAQSPDPQLRQNSLYNLGNAEAAAKNYDRAIEAFESVLKESPEDRQAKENMEYAKVLKQQQQQQRQKGDQQQKQSKEQQQEQGEEQQQEQGEEQQQEQGEEQQQEQGEEQQQDRSHADSQSSSEQKDSDAGQHQAQAQSQSERQEKPKDDQQGQEHEQAAQQEGQSQKQAGPGAAQEQDGQQSAIVPGEKQEMTQQEAERLLRSLNERSQGLRYVPKHILKNSGERDQKVDW